MRLRRVTKSHLALLVRKRPQLLARPRVEVRLWVALVAVGRVRLVGDDPHRAHALAGLLARPAQLRPPVLVAVAINVLKVAALKRRIVSIDLALLLVHVRGPVPRVALTAVRAVVHPLASLAPPRVQPPLSVDLWLRVLLVRVPVVFHRLLGVGGAPHAG